MKANFYLVDSAEPSKLDKVCNTLTYKAYQLGKTVHIHCASKVQAQSIDVMLWNFRADAFVPHSLGEECKIIVDWKNTWQQDILINLSDTLPLGWTSCQKICEIVGADNQSREEARARWREYTNRQFQVQKYTIDG